MELIWLDGDIMDSWDDLIEHLDFIGEIQPLNSGSLVYRGVVLTRAELVEVLKPLVELNAQLYDAWELLYEFCDPSIPRSLEPFREKVEAYLDDPIGWREKE